MEARSLAVFGDLLRGCDKAFHANRLRAAAAPLNTFPFPYTVHGVPDVSRDRESQSQSDPTSILTRTILPEGRKHQSAALRLMRLADHEKSVRISFGHYLPYGTLLCHGTSKGAAADQSYPSGQYTLLARHF